MRTGVQVPTPLCFKRESIINFKYPEDIFFHQKSVERKAILTEET